MGDVELGMGDGRLGIVVFLLGSDLVRQGKMVHLRGTVRGRAGIGR
jgi:hypothetical protein